MSDNDDHAAKSKDARQARLGAALRENLKRRKAQLKGRASPAPDEPPADTEPDRG